MSEASVEMELPDIPGRTWQRALDTWLPSPTDILPPADQTPFRGGSYPVQARTVVVFEGPVSVFSPR
jgi:glycogen operon protein